MREVTGLFLVNFPTGRDIVVMMGTENEISAFCNGEEVTLTDDEERYLREQLKEAQGQ